MSHVHVARLSGTSKRHAVLRGRPNETLWVFDDADWAVMLEHSKSLVCPEPGCGIQLFPRPQSADSDIVRHLWLGTRQKTGCEHWTGGSDGGPMTARHVWVQARILRTCRDLGYTAVPEDHHTRADVYVSEPSTALEVQLRATAFNDRTEARRAKGADTIWFLAHDVSRSNASIKNAIATLPTVRFQVGDRRNRTRGAAEFEPWLDRTGGLDEFAEIRVYGTTFDLDTRTGTPRLEHAGMALPTFLREVLSGRRRWIEPGQPGMPTNPSGGHRPGWVRAGDLDTVREHERNRKPAPAEVRPAPTAAPPAALRREVTPPLPPRSATSDAHVDEFFLGLAVIAVVILIVIALSVWLL
ncbi:hypothetical protein [Nocardia sp. NPDC057030]|uniref:hypothetical protein n=1 Tax=unclassified Nocardia TaxID=2637762 RepID=UPI003628B10E